MNKYQITYHYPYECVGDFTTKYQTIMYDTDIESLYTKFLSKYPNTAINNIHIEEDGEFKIVRRRKRIKNYIL
jgi:hypothetical protein